MTKEQFSMMMGHIDGELLRREDRAVEWRAAKRSRRGWIAVAAACLCVTVAAAIRIPMALQNASIGRIDQYSSGEECCYAIPMPGEYFCYSSVNEAREHYEGRNVTFLLAFDIYKDGTTLVEGDELTAEYQRLVELGYTLYRVDDHWTYYGQGQKRYISIVVGEFTEEQLADFNVNPAYGYAFHFEKNGDGSAISVDKGDLISDFDAMTP